MPLKRLFNSILGIPSHPSPPKEERNRGAAKTTVEPESRRSLKAAKPTTPARNLMDMMSRGSQASICRLVKRSGAASVLEIGVGNGERAIAVAQSLIETNPETSVRYAAIDMFEMAGGSLTLKDFNRKLREQNVQPSLVPMDVVAGLARVSSTLGMMDLVLIAEPKEPIEIETVKVILRRLAHENTAIYQLEEEKWHKIDLYGAGSSIRRAA